MVRPDRARHRSERGRQPRGRSNLDWRFPHDRHPRGPSVDARSSRPTPTSSGPSVPPSAIAARWAAAFPSTMPACRRKRTTRISVWASSSGLRPTTPPSNSITSSRTTCCITRRYPGIAGTWAARPLNAGVGWADKLWGTDKSGLLDKTAGLPVFSFSGNIPYTTLGTGWIGSGFEAINRWQFANDLTWVKGRHSIKVGYEFRFHQFNFHGWAAASAGNFNFSRLGTGGFDAAAIASPRPGILSPRSCWGRCRLPARSSRRLPRSTANSCRRTSTTTTR